MTKNMRFTDSHCHLDFDAFHSQLPQLLAQCQQQHIQQIIIPAIGAENWQKVLDVSKKFHSKPIKLYPCLGIHPWFLNNITDDVIAQLESLIIKSKSLIVAIGETGIDGVIAKEQNNLSLQLTLFEQQIKLAIKYQLPLIIHHRRSHPYILALLKKYHSHYGGIIHAFSGSYQEACQYIDLGFKLGIGGTITYPRAKKTINAIKRLPLTALVLETDAPAMPLAGFQGQDNSPLQLIEIFNTLCQLRSEPKEIIANTIENNITDVFGIT